MDIIKQPSRFLAMVLSFCMLLTMLPIGAVTVQAASGTVAYIGDTGYDSLGSAVAAAEAGNTITLKANDETAQTITISKDLTIELDGHDLTNTSFNITRGTVVIRDRRGIATISCEYEQAIEADFNSRVYGTIVSKGGSLTLEGVNVNGFERTIGNQGYLPKAVLIEGGTVTINSGSFKGGNDSNSGGDAVYFDEGNLTINGGTFTGGDGGGCGLSSSDEPGDSLSIRHGTFIGGGNNSAAFWLGGNINSQSDLEEYFLGDGNYIVGAFNQYRVTIGTGFFLSPVFTEPENGSGDVNDPAIIELPTGDSATLEPHVLGGGGGDLTYTWYKDGEIIDNASGSTYTVNGTGDFPGDYHVVISEEGTEHEITVYWRVVEIEAYNVWVGGVPVTAQNASDVLGDGTVSYDAEKKTLTLNGADITDAESVPGGGYAAILSYDDLNIVLAEGSENKITLNGDEFFTGMVAVSEGGLGTDVKNITVSGSGSLDIDITTSNAAAFGIMGSAVTIDSGAEVGVTVNGTSTESMVAYIGIMGNVGVAIKNSTVTTTASDKEGTNVAIMSTGAVTIENADVTASGYAGIMGATGVSITGESTVKATGTGYAIASQTGNITWSNTLIAQGRADAAAGELSEVMTGSVGYNTFVLASNTSTVARYVEIVPASSLHSHAVCGETDCAHGDHEPVIYTALDDGAGNLTGGITTPGGYYSNVLKAGNYYLTDDITNVNSSIEITGTVNLCLNGHTISGIAAYGIFRIGAGGVLNICDCQGDGKIMETGTDEHNPVFLHSGGTLNLYSGAIESRITAVVIDEDPSDNTDSTGGTVNIYGGTVSSTGTDYQAIKVNANMTNAAVNISGGSVTSPRRVISADSGTITISGGEIEGDIDTDGAIALSNGTITGDVEAYSDMTMTGGEITGNVSAYSNVTMSGGTINGRLGTYGTGSSNARRSVKISGSAKIESASGYAIQIVQQSTYIDLEISSGTITAENGYGVYIDNGTSRLYLSGSPDISGGTADIRSSTGIDLDFVNLVLHAKGDEESVYTGGVLSIEPRSPGDNQYVAQGVFDEGMLDKLSLSGLPDYYLRYDAANKAIRMNNQTYTITLPSGDGYTVTAANDSSSPVRRGESYSFTVTVNAEDKYYTTSRFAVKANNRTLTPDGSGVYTISDIAADQTVTVEGVAQDTTAPAAEIQLGTNTWNQFLNSITFGLFFKDTQTVTISATDKETGVEKTEYFVSDTAYADSDALEDAASGKWATYSAAFSIEPNSKNFIYVKATDKMGNVGYARSDGIVLYTDAEQVTQSISFTKTGTEGVTAEVILYGNTIDEIYCDNAKLNAGTDYTVNGETITFKASWLNSLSAGDYTLTVHYNPMGEEYDDNDGNDAPATTTIALRVEKATGSVEITNDISKTYDGEGVIDVIYSTPSTGSVTVEYKGADDSTYTTTEPSAVGEYTVRVTVEEDDDYTEASDTADFKITYLDAPADPFQLSGTSGQNGWYTSDVTITPPENYAVSSTLDGIYSDTLTVSAGAENVMIYLKNEKGEMTNAITVGEIKIDKDEPTITATGNTTEYLQSDTVTIAPTVGVSGIVKVTVSKDNGEAVDITESYTGGYEVTENGTYTFAVINGAGVTATGSITYTNIDTAKPVVEITATADGEAYTDGAWTNADVTLSVSNGNEDNLGETKLEYKVDDGEWQTYSSTITISEDTNGTKYTFRATSASGVVSDETSITVKLDKTAPGSVTVSHKTNPFKEFINTIIFGLFFNDTQTVIISATDAGSGVKEISYQLGDGEQQTVTADENGQITFNVAPQFIGNINSVTVTDNAGNDSEPKSYEYFAVDAETPEAPTISTGGYTPGQWTNGDVTITVSGVTADSGIAKYQYSTNGGQSWQDMTASETTEATVTTPASVDEAQLTINASTTAEGTIYIFRAISNSGVEGTGSNSITVKIDKTEPTIEVSGNTTEYLQKDTIDIETAAGVSGIASVTVSKDNGEAVDITESYTSGYEVTENGAYTFAVTNGAGVTATTSITYENIDTAKPVVVIDSNGYTDDAWTNSDVTLEVSNGTANLGDTKFEYKVDDGQWQTYNTLITVSEDTNGTVYTFRATSASGVVSDEASITVKLDKTAPDGDIKIEENSVKAFISAVTFGLFFNDSVDVAITSEDTGSGLQSTWYYRSEAILTEEQIATLTDADWTAYTGTIGVTAADAETFVCYVKIIDNAGNETCFASNGATFDLTDPVISGVANQGEYYTTQTVQVTDENLDTVTLNGETAGSQITLAGNVDTDTEYTIVATDKAGNTTTVTVTMKPTAGLGDAVEGIAPEDVTSSDKEAIEDYLDDLNTRLEDENLTDGEKEVIQDLIDGAQDLLDKIDEAEQAANTENIQQAQDITADNVKPEDKEVLEAAKDDIEQALEDYSDNYTEDEKAQLEETLEQTKDALDIIQWVENVEDAIGELPESVSPDDSEAEEQVNAAKEQYDGLSEHGQSLISDEATDKLNTLLSQLGDYRIIEGNGSTWTKESVEGLTFVANGAYSKFTGIEIDGKVVDADCYTAESGSTVITLKPDYLNALTAEEHAITVLYTDGEATGIFTIAENPGDTTSPQTGDDSHIVLWIMLMLISGGAILTMSTRRRRKKT